MTGVGQGEGKGALEESCAHARSDHGEGGRRPEKEGVTRAFCLLFVCGGCGYRMCLEHRIGAWARLALLESALIIMRKRRCGLHIDWSENPIRCPFGPSDDAVKKILMGDQTL